MQRRTYPFAFVILSPGSKIGHTPRKNPSAPMGAAATSRINAYRGWCRTPVLHQPFAAKKYDTTIYRKLQVFFQQIVKYFLKNPAFCRNSLSRPFPAFFLWGYHLLPWYIIHVPAQKARVVSRIFCLPWCIFCCLGVVGIFGEEMLSFGAVRVSRERNSLYQGMFIFFSIYIRNNASGQCKHRPVGTHLPPNIPPQPSHHLKSQGRAFLHSPDFNLSSL